MSILHEMLKWQKYQILVSMRSVEATSGSTMHVVSYWVKTCIEELMPSTSSCVKDSENIMQMLNKCLNSLIYTCVTEVDVTGAWLGIDRNESLKATITWLDLCIFSHDKKTRKDTITFIELWLKFNLFRFGSTCYR